VHACTCVLVYWVAGDAFGRVSGWYAALALASFPLLFHPLVVLHVVGGFADGGLFIPPNLMWYTHLTELAIALLIWLTLKQCHWATFGIAWGVGALTNPAVLSVAPAFLAWRLWQGGK